MPDRSHQSNRIPLGAIGIALAFTVIILLALMTTAVAAQDGAATEEPTPSEFDFNLPVTPVQEATFDAQSLPSLTGVNGHAAIASVSIRSGPGLNYRRIGALRKDGWIDIVGWNGWKEGRVCSAVLTDDLDMWVEVQFGGERRGWIARCVLETKGKITNLPIVSADGTATLQR